ncbi:Coronin-like protein crn1 [Marasmius crinis-equi]|uniref:Coronin n=1 Tax=Marasmius crinis-equi TaxID=585013 RepID=A0ABR3FE48_9AGAR
MASPPQWAVWSRRPRDPTNAPSLIFSPKTNPPEHILQYALPDPTPPASPELSPLRLSSEELTDKTDTPAETETPATTVPTSPATTNAEVPPAKEVESTPPPPPPVKKSWASLLQPTASSSGSKKNQLPTSSIIGFSIPASSSSDLPAPKRHALSVLLNGATTNPTAEIRIRSRGLTNTGNVCFANSVLQVLLYCEPFWRLFMQLGELLPASSAEETTLLKATADFVKDFLPPSEEVKVNGAGGRGKGKEREVLSEDWDEQDAFIPNYIYDALKSKKRFETLMGGGMGANGGYQGQEDAEEFLGFYLDTLEEELLALAEHISPSQTQKPAGGVEGVEEKEEDPPPETEDGWLEVGKKNRTIVTRTIKTAESPISRVFGGKFRSTLRAPGQKDSVMVEDWRSLRVDIQSDSIHSIEDALSHISQPQPIQMSHPTQPGSTIDASQQILVESLPPILVVHLKRFCYDIGVGGVMKVSKQVTFNDELTIPGDVLAPAARGKNRSTRYRLFGAVIYHHGLSASGGHYTLDVLHPTRFPPRSTGKPEEQARSREGWIRIDDELVSDVRHADIFASTAFERDDAASRHVFGQPSKKEAGIENVKVTNSAWDTNVISASGQYLSINWNASGGGAFAIFPLPSPFQPIPGFPHKLPDSLPLARSHTAPVLDTDWSPHNDSLVASGGEDGKVMIWKVESSAFEGWGQEGYIPKDFDPVWRVDGSPRKIGQVLFHPTASNVLASASGEHTVKLWDLAQTESPRSVLSGHGDAIQSLAFNSTGTLLATTCRDRKLRIFDPRAGGEAVSITDGHGGIKGARVVWMGDLDRLATTGFSKMSERQVGIWEVGAGLKNLKMTPIDQSSGVLMPFWSDNGILFLAGKGDGNIRYFEYLPENDSLAALDEYKSTEPQRGMAFLPRRALNVSDNEIARAYKVSGSYIEPIAFIVPRKADSFQSDIFPPALSIEPSLDAAEFFNGKTATRNLVSLDSGKTFASPSAASSPVPPPSAPAPVKQPSISVTPPASTPTAAAPSPVTKSYSAPPAQAQAAPETPKSEPVSTPVSSSQGDDSQTQALRQENSQLKSELREARELIRTLELQIESQKANARKAAQALLEVGQ